ncbi:MAG: ADP-ribosylglycohydrolase family protein [Christensenellales bacterium]|jgi:ADP-ribosylglycohydrolase
MLFDSELIDIQKIHAWELYSESLLSEVRQAKDEGRDISEFEAAARSVAAMPKSAYREDLADILFRALTTAPIRADYPYIEPDDLCEIRAARPKNRKEFSKPDKTSLAPKIRGAWYGRIAGCLLGKPVEGWHTKELHEMLRKTGNFPLSRYMTSVDLSSMGKDFCRANEVGRTWADTLDGCAPVDDDTNYTALAVRVIDRFGRDFTPRDMATAWVDMQPMNAYCTAERRAFKNFVAGIMPPKSATYKNPDREFIGAQIRGDYFGYINPASPEAAADMAWRDACISHVKNGIYGEMFVAAMLAAAAVTSDVREVLRAGLGEIPEKSRLAEAIESVLSWFDGGIPQEDVFRRIHASWDEYLPFDWVHTIPNAMIVAASLLYGDGDYTKTICMAVETGFDTDCNGATCGSIFGMMHGDTAIGEEWKAPLCGTLDTSIFGVNRASIDELVSRTLGHIE